MSFTSFSRMLWLILISSILVFVFIIWPTSRRLQLKHLKLRVPFNHIAFFHPFCDTGGGGERVLWTGVKAIQDRYPGKTCLIYIWNGANTLEILQKVAIQFGFKLDPKRIVFVKLRTWKLLEASRFWYLIRYPFLTLILSSLGSMITGWEAMIHFRPAVLVESVGLAFIYPIARFFGAKVIAYVHYPTISTDMINAIESRTIAFNNSSVVAKSSWLSTIKLHYYKLFSRIYALFGSHANYSMVGST